MALLQDGGDRSPPTEVTPGLPLVRSVSAENGKLTGIK